MSSWRDDLLNPNIRKLLGLFGLDKNYVNGEGIWLCDDQGNRVMDFISQYGAVSFGYNPEFIWDALDDVRRRKVPTLVQPSLPGEALALANRLAELTPGDLCYCTFCQSGSEAVEAALKLARSTTGRKLIVSTEDGFHGKTLGALSATGKDSYQKPFCAPAPDFIRIPFNDIQALETLFEQQGSSIAGFIVEPVQGEGGIRPARTEYLQAAQRLCRSNGALFIVDEIQTGLGRTGRLFACEHHDLEPDVMLLAKALGGGMIPLGVCISSPRVWNDDFGNLHSSTFANNNMSAAVGLAVLEHLCQDDQAFIVEVERKGEYLLRSVQELARQYPESVREVRGQGLMVGLEFHDIQDCGSYELAFLLEQGGLTALLAGFLLNVCGIRLAPFLNHSMTLRLEPAFIVSYEEIDVMMDALRLLCEILEKRNYALLYRHLIGDLTKPKEIQDFRQSTRLVRFSPYGPTDEIARRFAFVVHYPAPEDVVLNNPSFSAWSREEIYSFMEWEARTETPGVCCHMPAIRSADGTLVEGWLIGIPYGAREMMNGQKDAAVQSIARAVDQAKELGADIVGLGALTSVVTRGGRAVTGRGIAVTSGNSFTTLMAVEALFRGALQMAVEPLAARGAVLGANGAIGRACALMMSERICDMVLFGNPQHAVSSCRRLSSLADDIVNYGRERWLAGQLDGFSLWLHKAEQALRACSDSAASEYLCCIHEKELLSWQDIESLCAYLGIDAPLQFSLKVAEDLPTCDLVIAASNSPEYLIAAEDLKPGAVVCDVARPVDVAPEVYALRDDVLILEGGLVQYPDIVAFGPNLGCRDGVNLACLSETVLLCMAGECRDYSIGQKLSLDTVQELRQMAEQHGFRLAGLKMGTTEITAGDIEAIYRRSLKRSEDDGQSVFETAEWDE